MSKQLKDEDRRAVDLIMDTNPTAIQESGKPVFALASQGAFHDRLAGVEKILHVLEEMPAPDPSVNLLEKTMKFIDESMHNQAIGHGAARESRPAILNASNAHRPA